MKPLPQQELLLELVHVSGDIAVPGPKAESILWRTLEECRRKGWITLSEIGGDCHKVSLTALGKLQTHRPA